MTPPSPNRADGAEPQPGFLADLTGRRASLAALVLLVAYLVPVGLAWGIVWATEAGHLGSSSWFPPTLVGVLGFGLLVGLTLRFGGWFRAISFGEEYMLSFRPLAGYGLGWWRFVVQIGSLILVAFATAHAEIDANIASLTSAATEALPAYAERAPIQADWEPWSSDVTQNGYADLPNATSVRDYLVPASFGEAQMRKWLGDAGWTDGVGGQPPIGTLQAIECETNDYFSSCEAEVTPAAGDPVEYFVHLSLDEVSTSAGPAGMLSVEIEYQQAER